MWQGMGAGAAVGITAVTRRQGGFDGISEATSGIDIFATHYHIASGSAADHGDGKIDLSSVLHRSRRTGGQPRFMDR